MEREIKIGKVTLVVDDPNNMLGPAAPLAVKAEQLGLETAKTRQEEAGPFPADGYPNPNDPMGYIGARVSLFDGVAHGRGKSWALWFAWDFSAAVVYTLAFALMWSGGVASVCFAVALLIGHTAFFVHALVTRRKRSAPYPQPSNGPDPRRP